MPKLHIHSIYRSKAFKIAGVPPGGKVIFKARRADAVLPYTSTESRIATAVWLGSLSGTIKLRSNRNSYDYIHWIRSDAKNARFREKYIVTPKGEMVTVELDVTFTQAMHAFYHKMWWL